jgi:hypothetical protein
MVTMMMEVVARQKGNNAHIAYVRSTRKRGTKLPPANCMQLYVGWMRRKLCCVSDT